MKNTFLSIAIVAILLYSCGGQQKNISTSDDSMNKVSDTIRIASEDDPEHQIIIFEPGFSAWLASTARPRDYYSQNFLEARNIIYVTEWNQRVIQPSRFNSNLYQLQIDYRQNVDYGYEVNYQLYYYFIFFQQKYNQQLAAFPARI